MEAERLQGFPEGWTILESESDPERLDTLRYHALGNAVTVPVASWIARRAARYLVQDVEQDAFSESQLQVFEEALV